MRYIRLPRTDLKSSVICLGSMVSDERSPLMVCFDEFVERGGNCFDTANMYGRWLPEGTNVNEQVFGRWLARKGPAFRDSIILCTKGGHPPLGHMDQHRLSKQDIASDLEESLRALQVETVDLYWLHRDDPSMPVSEILTYLNEFAAQGKIRFFGVSNWRASRIREADAYAREHGIQGFVANQPMWSYALINQSAIDEHTMVAMDEDAFLFHSKTGLSVLPYSSNAKGYFQKQILGETMRKDYATWYDRPENRARLDILVEVAAERECSVTQVSLAYMLAQPFPTIPIVGFSGSHQLLESMAAVDISFDLATMNRLRVDPHALF